MTPSARIQAAIEILESLQGVARPAGRFLHDWFRARRYAGSRDRAAIAERVFAVLRQRASFAWRMGGEGLRECVISALLAEGLGEAEIAALFDGAGYGPEALSEEERRHIAFEPQKPMSIPVQGNFPAFLENELRRAFGAGLLDEMRAMAQRASVDLRVNTLRADPADILAALGAEGFEVKPGRYSPLAIRLPPGPRGLERHPLFLSGAYEFQDEAAQISVLLSNAKPGMRVFDLAAGAGGKSLALAAAMSNEGEIAARDIRGPALAELGKRAVRAGAMIVRAEFSSPVHGGGGPSGRRGEFDLVFLDTPCSGSGVWRRQPENKWRLTQARLDELTALQDRLLDEAAAQTRPGGRLVYATCSVLPCENEDRAAAFRARHSDFRLHPASAAWRESQETAPPPGMDDFFRASPFSTGTDGFFTAIFRRG